jgi:FlaA1/EpsC-like NDP-sugar epimerase
VINLLLVIAALVSFRLFVREVYFRAHIKLGPLERSLIFGAGELGLITKKVLEQDQKISSSLVGFIDDSGHKIGKEIEGIRIYDAAGDKFIRLCNRMQITDVYLSIYHLTVERKIALIDTCGALKIRVHVVPSPGDWTEGVFEKKQIKPLNIEELLEREEIILPQNLLTDTYANATILVTGAAGSIGSEICRQICKIPFKKLILLDQSESGLFDLEFELRHQFGAQLDLQIEIASVRDGGRADQIFARYHPEYVFHAAAYKHVPLMETFPCEAIQTNIFGTKLIAELCLFYEVKKFVLVSTDKAVNPTNIMGATKRISELFVQHLSDHESSRTQFIITRFGNVLGSAGSVVTTFKKQIELGGPVTITHPEITRYFMTIPEASKLVLEAGKIGKSGDILLFDMGMPVKILDLATRMIQLAGFKPHEDIAIHHTGLRPGEKMYEELFKDSENFIKTDHPRILKAVKSEKQALNLKSLLEELQLNARTHENEKIPAILHQLLPEFRPYSYIENDFAEAVIKKAIGE